METPLLFVSSKMESMGADNAIYSDNNHIYTAMEMLNKQRQSSKLCDVVLRVFDIQISAHACVLAAASPYFDELFYDQDHVRQFCPKTPQVIEIQIDGQTDPAYKSAVEKVVNFMYTSEIELEHYVLSQVLEIARIMRMSSVIDLCDLYQKGYRPDVQENTKNRFEQQDCATQTSSINQDSEQCTTDIPSKTFSKERTLQKSTLNNRSVLNSNECRTKRRGRTRKEVSEKSLIQKSVENSNNDGKGESEKENDCELKQGKTSSEHDDHAEVIKASDNNVPVRVSRRGRIIKPKIYPDDIDMFIKQEVLSDIENEDKEIRSNKQTNKLKEEEFLDDEQADPSYSEKHKREKSPVKRYTCDQCAFSTSKLTEFNSHHGTHIDAKKKGSFCVVTSDIAADAFAANLQGHTGFAGFCCNFCSMKFNTKAKLVQHLPKHSKVKPYVCHICNAGFKWKHSLKAHMITHKDSKDYLCDTCGFATAHKAQLKSHRLIHTGETFKCPEPGCNYQATKRTNLKFHMITHTREKPHQCEVCGTSFSLVKNLKRHMLLHATDRRFKCEHCVFCSTRYDKLKEHYYKQHNIGEKPSKKLRLTDYLKAGETVPEVQEQHLEETVVEEPVIQISNEMDTIELQVVDHVGDIGPIQIVKMTSSSGESIPIAITQRGKEISYEIPVATDEEGKEIQYEIPSFPCQIVTQETLEETN